MNYYVTRSDFLNFKDTNTPADAVDDAVIDAILEQASRFIDDYTGRKFYPRFETRLLDIPSTITRDLSTLQFDDDLLSIDELLNGDGTAITEYILKEPNYTPYWCLKLRDTASVTWEPDSSGSSEQVISLSGIWGYHDRFAYAWKPITTLSVAITDITSLTLSVTSNNDLSKGSIIKIGDEVMNVVSTGTGTITVDFRGDNGTTAATHLISSPVYVWQVIQPIKQACLMITNSLYQKRFGENATGNTIVTPMGTVIPPKDIPDAALAMLRPYVRF